MATLTLAQAQTIVRVALEHCRAGKFAPMGVAVLDARGALRAFAAEDGTSMQRSVVAIGKANGSLAMGVGSRRLEAMAQQRPHFVGALAASVSGPFIPVPGGVLIKADGEIIGAVGVTGDTSDNDEAAALAGIAAAGLTGDPG
jgi:uncharacterized protein GlcG (DUF336 family)